MMVLVVSACPAGLRGDLTKWLFQISPTVFVGRPSARVREAIWGRTVELCKDGTAILVWSSDNEQGLEFRTHRTEWQPADFDGLTLIRRPTHRTPPQRRTGWSKARNMNRARRRC